VVIMYLSIVAKGIATSMESIFGRQVCVKSDNGHQKGLSRVQKPGFGLYKLEEAPTRL